MYRRDIKLRISIVPIILIVLLASIGTSRNKNNVIGVEGRGLWVVRYDMSQPESIDDAIATAKRLNVNTLFVQVNGRAEAYYSSKLLPMAPEIKQGFDPLAYIISKAHSEGIEVHAWINAYTISSFERRPISPEHILNKHPEWVTYDKKGISMNDYSGPGVAERFVSIYLDPGVKQVQDFIYDVSMELVKLYPIDGLHLDYLRYPGKDFGYNPMSVERFRAEYGGAPEDSVDDWDKWRASQVTEILRRIYKGTKAIEPNLKVSAAVMSDLYSARDNVLQDWRLWLKEEILDFIVLMSYSEDFNMVERQTAMAVAIAEKTPVYVGIGAYKMVGRPDLIERQINLVRKTGAAGIALFSYGSIKDDVQSMEALANGPFKYPVSVPYR